MDAAGNHMARTVDTATVWNEAKVLELIHEVFKRVLDSVEELGLDQTLDNPVRVPVVLGWCMHGESSMSANERMHVALSSIHGGCDAFKLDGAAALRLRHFPQNAARKKLTIS